LPNITNVFHGRDVGYKIGCIDLDQALRNISGTKERAKLGPPSAEARKKANPDVVRAGHSPRRWN
jgi:hypothetical protein